MIRTESHMERQQDAMHGPAATQIVRNLTAQMLCHIAEVNECCLDLMTAAASRDDSANSLGLNRQVRPLLRHVRPGTRHRATQQALPLVDMQFCDDYWWQAVRGDPDRSWEDSARASSVPKRAAVRLVRTTLIVGRQSLLGDADLTRTLFGMSRSVAEVIVGLRLADIERIAERQYPHIRPRWNDRPWLWMKLLNAAHRDDARALRELNIHALQLLAGENFHRRKESSVRKASVD